MAGTAEPCRARVWGGGENQQTAEDSWALESQKQQRMTEARGGGAARSSCVARWRMGVWGLVEGEAAHEHSRQRRKEEPLLFYVPSRTLGHKALRSARASQRNSGLVGWPVSWPGQACSWREGPLTPVEVWKSFLDQVALSWVLDLKEGLGGRRVPWTERRAHAKVLIDTSSGGGLGGQG